MASPALLPRRTLVFYALPNLASAVATLPLALLPLGPADQVDCLALDRSGLGGLWSPGQWQVELAAPERPGVGLRQGNELVAMACGWLVLDELHITLVAVTPTRRRCRLGRRVLDALLERGREGGASRATLEVAHSNAAARALYAAAGFREAGVRRGYYRNGDDALIQWVNLSLSSRCG
jgi:ribosomal-protein-alanine N-acetyltransferase